MPIRGVLMLSISIFSVSELQRLRKSSAEAPSLLECYAEMQLIFCKGTEKKRHVTASKHNYIKIQGLDIPNLQPFLYIYNKV